MCPCAHAHVHTHTYCLSPFGPLSQNTIDWVAQTQNICFSQFWKLGKSKIKALADLVSGESLLPGSSPCVLLMEGTREFSLASLL